MAPGRAQAETWIFGIDTCQTIKSNTKKSFHEAFVKKLHIGWIARYGPRSLTRCLSHPHPKGHYKCPTTSTLSIEESKILREELKLRILPVQFAPSGGVRLNRYTGARAGKNFVAWAKCMGIPTGVHLWCDLEGRATTASARKPSDQIKRCIEYVNAWGNEAVKAGYKAGLYLSQSLPTGFSSYHLKQLKHFSCYWKSATNVPMPPGGYSILQQRQIKHPGGLEYRYIERKNKKHDRDVIKTRKVIFNYDPDLLVLSTNNPPVLWA